MRRCIVNDDYRVILADPPWQYNDKLKMSDVPRGSDANYSTMPFEDIAQLSKISEEPVSHTIAGHEISYTAILFLWVTNPFLLNGDGASLCLRWGFVPKQLMTWFKTKKDAFDEDEKSLAMGMGRITRGATEHVIIATKGQYSKLVKCHDVRNVLFAPRRAHSKKPDELYPVIEELFDGPYLELFARFRRNGWTSWGKALR